MSYTLYRGGWLDYNGCHTILDGNMGVMIKFVDAHKYKCIYELLANAIYIGMNSYGIYIEDKEKIGGISKNKGRWSMWINKRDEFYIDENPKILEKIKKFERAKPVLQAAQAVEGQVWWDAPQIWNNAPIQAQFVPQANVWMNAIPVQNNQADNF